MSVDVWEPGKGKAPRKVEAQLLQAFVAFAGTLQDSVSAQSLEEAGLASENWVMTQGEEAWQGCESCTTEDLVRLVRLFTLLEMQVSGWDAGKTSPVIALVRILKDRDEFEPALRKWIKANTRNRYLPHGSAL